MIVTCKNGHKFNAPQIVFVFPVIVCWKCVAGTK